TARGGEGGRCRGGRGPAIPGLWRRPPGPAPPQLELPLCGRRPGPLRRRGGAAGVHGKVVSARRLSRNILRRGPAQVNRKRLGVPAGPPLLSGAAFGPVALTGRRASAGSGPETTAVHLDRPKLPDSVQGRQSRSTNDRLPFLRRILRPAAARRRVR